MAKKNFPVVVNKRLEDSLNHRAEVTVKRFQKEIFPLLLNFGLFDDQHIEKYLGCDTTEAIYNDLLTEDPSRIFILEQEAHIEELKENLNERRDVWGIFRDSTSEAKSPKEEGFVFKPIPGAEISRRNDILKALSVRNLQFFIDREYFKEISIVHPTEEQVELYNVLSDFCETFNKKKWHITPSIFHTIGISEKGIYPILQNILGLNWCYEIKKE